MSFLDIDYPAESRFTTAGGLVVTRSTTPADPADFVGLARDLDRRRGLLMDCGHDVPGRYQPQAIGFRDPPLAITARGRDFRIEALNERGRLLLPAMETALCHVPELTLTRGAAALTGVVAAPRELVPEEQRSRQASVFTVLRRLLGLLATGEDHHLGLYGAFGYDLVFQFEPLPLRLDRPADQRDLMLYLPDELLVLDRRRRIARRIRYEFSTSAGITLGLARIGVVSAYEAGEGGEAGSDHGPGEYAATVERARAAFAAGDLFEAVPGQLFREPCARGPSAVFERLRTANPAPYGALLNLGEGEFLVSASPEMFMRAEGRRVETCPISGTIARGRDALGDAGQIRALLNSDKDAAELTMCTDVDRNDKARVCEPGSVRILGRRLIETYSRLFHTVDHVEGRLRPEFDALDAFLSHAWAVTVTGAPKPGALRFIEASERTPRRWYGGAFGALLADGSVDTGLTLRTLRLKDGMAEVRAGATLLIDSDPMAEDAECALKASALLAAVRADAEVQEAAGPVARMAGAGRRVLLVDHEDSFVHMLADYVRQAGAEVSVVRQPLARQALAEFDPDLVLLSPGPGRPADFAVSDTIAAALAQGTAVFGVCLGLQGIVEHFGGSLALGPAMHGKASEVAVRGGRLFGGLPRRFTVGRYHSLHARRDTLPDGLEVTAETDEGMVMAVEHRSLPVAGVQFHPESLMSLGEGVGLRLIETVMAGLVGSRRRLAA